MKNFKKIKVITSEFQMELSCCDVVRGFEGEMGGWKDSKKATSVVLERVVRPEHR